MVIYKLIDPRTEAVRYIGVAVNYRKRLISHIAAAKNGRAKHRPGYRPTHCANWIRSLLALGLRPSIEQIESVNSDNWAERERYWISHFRQFGCRLTNLTEGGEGTHGYTQPPEVRLKHSIAMKAACSDIDVIRRKSVSAMGHPVTEATKSKIAARATGRRHGDSFKQDKREALTERLLVLRRENIINECAHCDIPFQQTNLIQRYCSRKCCQTAARNKFRSLWGRGKSQRAAVEASLPVEATA